MISCSRQDDVRKKESMAVYNAGLMPNQRTKEHDPAKVNSNDKPKYHGDKPVKGGRARKAGPEAIQNATDFAYHVAPSFTC